MPLYVSQSLAVVMYIFGFREGYLWAVDEPGAPPRSAPVVQDPSRLFVATEAPS